MDYQALLRKRGILISLSAIACNRLSAVDERYDNPMIETFFKTIKSELI